MADFRSTDRFYATGKAPAVRTPWTTPVEGRQAAGERMLATRARAVWQFAEGPFPCVEFGFRPGDIAFNLPPGA